MDRRKTEHYICIGLLAAMLAICSVILADQKLLAFISEEKYEITGRDILNIIFMTDQFEMYPYLDKSDIEGLLPVFSFYITGIFFSGFSFLSKSKEYYCMVFSRVGSKDAAIKYMKKGNLKKIIIFACSYTIFCYGGMLYSLHLCFHRRILLQDIALIVELILHTVATVLMLMMLQKITLFSYIKWNAAFSFMIGLTIMTIVLILDMQIKNVNFILFSPIHSYLDSIGILGAFNIILYVIEKIFLYRYLSYEGGN